MQSSMDRIKHKLAEITAHIPKGRPVAYLDYPVHLNVGDILIMKGSERFFADHGYEVAARAAWPNFHSGLAARIGPEVTIILHGGGNFGDLYPVHQRFRESIVQRFPNNKIVVMPQSIHFGSVEAMAVSAEIFRRHRDVTIFARDQASFELARDHFSPRSFLMPDMAHQLWRMRPAAPSRERSGTLYMLRADIEAAGGQHAGLPPDGAHDWMDFIPVWSRRVFGLLFRLHCLEGRLDRSLGAQRLWYWYSDRLVGRFVRVFDGFDRVVSSRLHACILGTLMENQVRPLDNSYGKIGRYIAAWMDGIEFLEPEGAQAVSAPHRP